MDFHDHRQLVTGNKEFSERISILEVEMKLQKDAKFNIDVSAEFIYEDEIDTSIQNLHQIWLQD